jgi:hypothetical protein
MRLLTPTALPPGHGPRRAACPHWCHAPTPRGRLAQAMGAQAQAGAPALPLTPEHLLPVPPLLDAAWRAAQQEWLDMAVGQPVVLPGGWRQRWWVVGGGMQLRHNAVEECIQSGPSCRNLARDWGCR